MKSENKTLITDDNVIELGEKAILTGNAFAKDIASKLLSPKHDMFYKQSYFITVNDLIKNCLNDLISVIQYIENKVYIGHEINDNYGDILKRARKIVIDIQGSINLFKQEMEDEESMNESDEKSIQQKPNIQLPNNMPANNFTFNNSVHNYTHIILANNIPAPILITAANQSDIITAINDAVDKYTNLDDMSVYQLTPIRLKKKTIFTIDE